MTKYRVIISSRAEDQLASIYTYIAAKASPELAQSYTNAIIERCHSLGSLPYRGSRREDLGEGVRSIAFRRRVTIAYYVEPGQVHILGIFYGGQDIEALRQGEQN